MTIKKFSTSTIEQKPLVTFALFCYNQENFIREAIEAAIKQTYEPLEIIISDDCSTDRTYDVVKEMVASNKCNKKIIINRNKKNMGISAHVRYIHEMSSGEIIVNAAGDDISFPNRVEIIVNSFNDNHNNIQMIISNAIKISLNGESIGKLTLNANNELIDNPISPLYRNLPALNGCTVAIRKSVVDSFPAPDPNIFAEDVVLLRRAFLLGSVKYIPYELVKYRIGSGVSNKILSMHEESKRYFKNIKDQILRLKQFENDAKHINFNISGLTKKELNKSLIRLNLIDMCLDKLKIRDLIKVFKIIKLKEFLIVFKYFIINKYWNK